MAEVEMLQSLSGAPGLRLAAPRAPRRLPLAALVLALAAHAALLCALAGDSDDGLAGGGSQQLDAISVTLVSSAALEAREPSIAQLPIPATATSIDNDDGSAESNPAPRREKQEATEDKKTAAEPAQADAVLPLPAEKLKQEHAEESTPTPAGGVAVRGNEPTPAPPKIAPAAASAGAVREYARYISQALAKSRPKGTGAHGTVRIRLAISPTGGLASVEIIRSSGNRRLDETAIAAVHQAALPPPPPGMTMSQLTYEVPYHFR
jgi:periplasmic protein TonB